MRTGPKLSFDWLYLFSAWDSGMYFDVAQHWYPSVLSPQWAFLPLYPTTLKIFTLAGMDLGLSAFIVAIICGVTSVSLFQQVAEQYMEKRQAILAATLYFLFPPVFVFSGASYPESMFLLLSLVSWRLHQRDADFKASLAAALCSLARVEGFLIAIPLLFDFVRRKRFRRITYLSIPLLATASWEVYGFARTGVWLPTRAAGRFWMTPKAEAVIIAIDQLAKGNFGSISVLAPYFWLILAVLASLAVVLFLARQNWRIDKALSVYVLGATLILGATSRVGYRSFPRVLSFLFPIGLPFHSRRVTLLIIVFLAFLILDYIAWLAFLTDGFY
jgi:hypothetical protein